jgi:feruloyl esterase
LPATGWSGRYESVGNGGFAGSIRYDSMVGPLLGGSAVASTDDGHTGPAVGPTAAAWALGHPEKMIDFGYRAVHLTAVAGKAITAAYYGRRATRAYFVGCSKGGQEGLMEAQRYPDDFDGIVSGAAANQWTDLFSSFSWSAKMNFDGPAAGYISAADTKAIGAAVLAGCDAADGVKDGLVSDPVHCKVDVDALALTPEQKVTLKAIYSGIDPVTGKSVYPGQAAGGEAVEWGSTISGPDRDRGADAAQQAMYGNDFFTDFVFADPAWTFRRFDIVQTPARAVATVGKIMNATDTGYAGYKAHGGKIIEYHGLADGVVTPLGAIRYYVTKAQGGAGKTQAFYRLFLAPGVGHCGNGPGPSQFGQQGGDGDAGHDMVKALETWVEDGVGPERIVATRYDRGDRTKPPLMTRPLCLYPKMARYDGTGDTAKAESFICR